MIRVLVVLVFNCDARVYVEAGITVEIAVLVKMQVATGVVGNAAVFENVLLAIPEARLLLRLNRGRRGEQNAEKHAGEE
jgi:hypothetical protein